MPSASTAFLSSWSIRKTLYALVLCAIFPALAVLVYNGVDDFRRKQEDTLKQTLNIIQYLARQQQMLTENTRVILHTLAKLPEVRQANIQALSELFKEMRTVHSNYANIIRMDLEGNLLGASQPITQPISVKDRKYFKDAVRTGRFSTGEFVVGRLINEPVFQYSTPVFDDSGQMIGVLAATMRLTSYDSLFANVALPPSWRFAMLDHNGVRLLRLPPDDKALVGELASPNVLNNIRSIKEDEGSFTTIGPDGIDVVYAIVRLRLTPGDDPYMTLVVGLPAPSLLQEFKTNVLPDVLLMLLVLGMALFIARSLGTAAISGGLTLLTQATRKLSAGDLSHRIGPLPACRDIRELGTAFDNMAESLLTESTERLQAEAELMRARGYIANILDSMPSVLIGVDSGGRVTHWNKAAEALTSIPVSQALGRPVDTVFPRLSTHMKNIQEALSEQRPVRVERNPFEEDGRQGYQDIVFYPLTGDAAGGVVVRVDDVTQRMRIEETMVQSEKMLSLGGLAAGMAHEINNPLGAILQSAQAIQRRLLGDSSVSLAAAEECGCSMESIRAFVGKRSIDALLDGIREAGKRAAHIVSNMLDFSRKSSTQRSATDINALLDRTVELGLSDFDLKKKYDFRKVKIVREYGQNLPEIACSRTEIEQVILNLIKNAAQAMAGHEYVDKEPTIMLRTMQDGGFLRIEVEDNGPGMTDTMRTRIFEPFFTTKPVGEGTGLGLSVSYFIIATNHGGSINVESTPGKGTTFIISLPVNGPPAGAAGEA